MCVQDVVILTNTRYPCCDYRVFRTTRDGQNNIMVVVYEGETAGRMGVGGVV